MGLQQRPDKSGMAVVSVYNYNLRVLRVVGLGVA